MNVNKRNQRKWLYLPLLVLVLAGCEKVVFEPVEIPNTAVGFAIDIQPILDAQCVTCHPPTKGLDLRDIQAYASLVPKYAAPVDSLNPEGSKLYVKITGNSHDPRTSDIEKQKILKWISQGVPNN